MRRDRLVVVGFRIDADPDLAGVDADDLIARYRASHVGADVAHAGQRSQFAADARGDAVRLGMRGAGRRGPVHQQLALLELRQQRLPEKRPYRDAGQHDDARRRRTPCAGASMRLAQSGFVFVAQTHGERGLARRARGVPQQEQAERRRDGQAQPASTPAPPAGRRAPAARRTRPTRRP